MHWKNALLPNLVLLLIGAVSSASEIDQRRVAVTFDDLPIAGSITKDARTQRVMTLSLLRALAYHEIPATGFVNESQLYVDNEISVPRVDLLRMWLDAGQDLGNHSYSHPDLNKTPLAEFKQDVLKGDRIIREMLAKRGRQPEYFRHPYLHTGSDIATKQAFEAFLAEQDYRVAPVTIDNSEWIFARAYDLAMLRGEMKSGEKVGTEYVDYMLRMFDFYESQSMQLFGRNIDHVLLVHANELNSTWFDSLAGRLKERGYEFISLAEALQDPVYQSADNYTGPGGITWLHRWAMAKQVDASMFEGEPETPPHILELTKLQEHRYRDDE